MIEPFSQFRRLKQPNLKSAETSNKSCTMGLIPSVSLSMDGIDTHLEKKQ